MLLAVLLGTALLSVTIVIHATGTVLWIAHLRLLARTRLRRRPGFRTLLPVLVQTAHVLLVMHLLEVSLWAFAYRWLPNAEVMSVEQTLYFSLVTFTTLGYGDITLDAPWRIMTGIEALNGVLLLGWSTALTFAVIQTALAAASENESD